MGIPGCRKYCDHGVKSMQTYFRDTENGGWFTAIEHKPSLDGHGIPWKEDGDTKWQYAHAFMILAAATATNASRPGANELLHAALANQLEQWYDEKTGTVSDMFSRDWSHCEPYRGMNSLLHTVEAYLAAAEAVQDVAWIERASRMLNFAYLEASHYEWRVPEHHDATWHPLLDFNIDEPNTPYYPYGYVIGHGMELSRLGLQLRGALREEGLPEPSFLLPSAIQLFERARLDGWRREGKPGFLYTTDFKGNPVLKERLQWVLCEGICATVAVRRALLDDGHNHGEVEQFEHSYHSWIDYLNDNMLVETGVLARALNEDSEPMEGTISARPDIYHSIQAFLMSRVPLWPPVGAALARGLLDKPEGIPHRPKTRWGRKNEDETKVPMISWLQSPRKDGTFG